MTTAVSPYGYNMLISTEFRYIGMAGTNCWESGTATCSNSEYWKNPGRVYPPGQKYHTMNSGRKRVEFASFPFYFIFSKLHRSFLKCILFHDFGC